jgi:hypothetical protein
MLLKAEEMNTISDCPRVRIGINNFYIHTEPNNFLSLEILHSDNSHLARRKTTVTLILRVIQQPGSSWQKL